MCLKQSCWVDEDDVEKWTRVSWCRRWRTTEQEVESVQLMLNASLSDPCRRWPVSSLDKVVSYQAFSATKLLQFIIMFAILQSSPLYALHFEYVCLLCYYSKQFGIIQYKCKKFQYILSLHTCINLLWHSKKTISAPTCSFSDCCWSPHADYMYVLALPTNYLSIYIL